MHFEKVQTARWCYFHFKGIAKVCKKNHPRKILYDICEMKLSFNAQCTLMQRREVILIK